MQSTQIVDSLINKSSFLNACELHIRKILEDGKLSIADIPYFILIIGTINQYRGSIKIRDVEIIPVLKELSMRLFDKFGLFPNLEDRTTAIATIDTLLPLVELSINLFKGRCNSCFSCFNPDISEQHMTNEISTIVEKRNSTITDITE